MNNLKEFSEEEIVKTIKENKVSASDLVDSGICSTCFDKRNNHILYGDNRDKMLYEDDKFECFLVGNPRAEGHTAISTKCDGPMNHFHIQLIPRYSSEKRGSKNFVKPRMEYKEDKEKIQKIRKILEL